MSRRCPARTRQIVQKVLLMGLKGSGLGVTCTRGYVVLHKDLQGLCKSYARGRRVQGLRRGYVGIY